MLRAEAGIRSGLPFFKHSSFDLEPLKQELGAHKLRYL